MKASLAKHIFKGSLISISIPLILILILAVKDFSLKNQLMLDHFFASNLKTIEHKREGFLKELEKIQSTFTKADQTKDKSIKKIFKQLSKSIRKGPRSLRLDKRHIYLSVEQLQKMSSEQHLDYVETISKSWQKPGNVTRRSIIQLRNYMKKKFYVPNDPSYPLLTDENFIVQYFSFELAYQYFSMSKYSLLTETLPWVVEVIPTQKAGNSFLKNITTSQILTQFPPKYTKVHDYLTSLKQLINFYPQANLDAFFEFNFFSKYFEFYYKTYSPNPQKLKFFEDQSIRDKNISPAKDHGLGTFAISLRTDNIFQRYISPDINENYRFASSQSRALAQLNQLEYFHHLQTIELREKNSYLKIQSSDIPGLLQANESIQLRVKSKNKTYVINIIKDFHFNHFYHIFLSNNKDIKAERSLINSASIAFVGIILLFAILLYSYVLVIPKIIRPISRFRKAIDQTTEDLSLSHVESFYSDFIEFQIMKKTFLRKIFRIRLQFRAAEALADLQNLNSKNTSLDEFEEECKLVYLQFFQKVYVRFDKLTNSVVLEDTEEFQKSLYDPESLILQDFSNFDAQVRFFYQRLSLHQEFMNRVQSDTELETAQVIQRDLLPSSDTLIEKISYTPFYLPARYLGGDFYDILSDHQRTIVLMADVSGKGLGSALFASSVKSYFAGQFYQQTPLEEMMQKTNNHTCNVNPNFLFCTLFAIELNHNDDTVHYCSAGHNDMILYKEEAQLLRAKGLPLGLLENQEYEKKSFPFNSGDLLFLYTDGVTEAENPSDELFGLKKLTQCLTSHKEQSTDTISNRLLELLSQHASGTEQSDDISYILLKKQ
ncbi:serine/threonine-protein phosphatase [bacterium]|nr:serine/threonine-protein phosphatase [bacterium]